jgi:signal peptidase I
MMNRVRAILNWLRRSGALGLLLMVGLAFSFRSAIADWNDVPTGSMKPTILIGDRIFVNKLAYDLKIPFTQVRVATWAAPARGDIVTCWSPADGARLVKRVVGVPGDVLAMKNSKLIVNGETVALTAADVAQITAAMGVDAADKIFYTEQLPDHPHLVAITPGKRAIRDFGPLNVPADKYFMMGDNRDNSADSRYFGFVDRDQVVGRVQGTVWSLDFENKYKPRWSRFFADMI